MNKIRISNGIVTHILRTMKEIKTVKIITFIGPNKH